MSRKKRFELPYVGFDYDNEDFDILYGSKGEATVVFKITNNVLQYSADPDHYMDFHHHLLNVVKTIGEGHYVQKLDIFSNKVFEDNISVEYLQKKYDDHFNGRVYKGITTYLAITRKPKNSSFIYNGKDDGAFFNKINKIHQSLSENHFAPVLLKENEINDLIRRTLMMDFASAVVSMDNMTTSNTHLNIGERKIKCLSLIDIDEIELPEQVSPYIERSDNSAMKGFPVDTMGFLHHVNGYETLIYNQVIEIPAQTQTLKKLQLKQKRHEATPDPQNLFCSQDIDNLLLDIARDNQLIVNAHFNIVVCANESQLTKVTNSIENTLSAQGIVANRNSYNQLELFRTILVGNSVELKEYDLFLTTSDASLCFFFKEALPVNEPSQFFMRFTDRQGIPLKIDPVDLPYDTGRIVNRNAFVLGPSGSGKSFLMNAKVEQKMLYNYDIVIVDTGDSYKGLCSYYNGKYITYTEQNPITMNPFIIGQSEFNIEKKDFLVTLIGLLWKGADGYLTQVEIDVITDVINNYYESFYNKKDRTWAESLSIEELEKFLHEHGISTELLLESARIKLIGSKNDYSDYYSILKVDQYASTDEIKRQFRKLSVIYHPDVSKNEDIAESTDLFIQLKTAYEVLSDDQKRKEYDKIIKVGQLTKELEQGKYDNAENSELILLYKEELIKRLLDLVNEYSIDRLCFNTFYEFSLRRIPVIIKKEHIKFDIDVYRFVLKKFYQGGEFGLILNENVDKSLFFERLIIFEIDNIKENKVLFPIVTLIIMDTFLQKMRFRKGQRKTLIIEEAWKAIASPMMANYLKYLYKTVRKFHGEAFVVTQELSDILGNEVVKDSILVNSDSIILLDQSKFKDNFETIADLLSLNIVEQRKIFTINNLDNKENRGKFKEFYFKRGNSGEVYGNEVSIFQYLTYTTERPEKNAVETYTNAFGNYPDGLDNFVSSFKKSGLKLPLWIEFVNLYGDVIPDPVIKEILKLIAEHKNNAINWIKRKLSQDDVSFKIFIDQKVYQNEKINI